MFILGSASPDLVSPAAELFAVREFHILQDPSNPAGAGIQVTPDLDNFKFDVAIRSDDGTTVTVQVDVHSSQSATALGTTVQPKEGETWADVWTDRENAAAHLDITWG